MDTFVSVGDITNFSDHMILLQCVIKPPCTDTHIADTALHRI